MKLFRTVFPGGSSEEHPGKSLKELNKQFAGQNVDVILERYDEAPNGCGHIFVNAAKIGNFITPLDYSDYYQAYDKLF